MLALFSLFFTSCEKENAADPNAVFWINYKYTTQAPNQASGSGSGNITNGIVHAVYLLDPYLHGSGICQGGKWSFTVKPTPATAIVTKAEQDEKTGVVTFEGGSSPATYEITITYTCPDGSSYSATITITM